MTSIPQLNDPSVQTHLTMMQSVISRMAGNSAVCKTLAATLVSTIGAVAYAAKVPEGLWIAVIPIVLFCYLDAMYLSLEHGFRQEYNYFVTRLHSGEVVSNEIFIIRPPTGYFHPTAVVRSLKSWSVWLPYGSLVVLVFLVMCFVRFNQPA
jgi:hypothetical protein